MPQHYDHPCDKGHDKYPVPKGDKIYWTCRRCSHVLYVTTNPNPNPKR